jgi:hypothetical protein
MENVALPLSTNAAITLKMRNVTRVKGKGPVLRCGISAAGMSFDIKNCIFEAGQENPQIFDCDTEVGADLLANPGRLDFKHCILWVPGWKPMDGPADALNRLIWFGKELPDISTSVRYIDPGFKSRIRGDYTLGDSHYAAGRGNADALPTERDLAGKAWTGNDVGCFANPPRKSLNLNQDLAVISGDSIARASYISRGSQKMGARFTAAVGSPSYDPRDYAVASLQANGFRWLVDYIMTERSPSVMACTIGVNNINVGHAPTAATPEEIAAVILNSLDRIAEWGATPLWIGSAPSAPSGEHLQDGLKVNAAVEAGCEKRGYLHGNLIEAFRDVENWTRVLYDGDGHGVHYDADGHAIAAEIAADLYRRAKGKAE